MSGESQGKWSEENLNAQRSYVTSSGQSNNLWVEFKSGHSGVSQGFQLTVLSVQGEDNSLGFLKIQIDENYHLYNFRGAGIPCGGYH